MPGSAKCHCFLIPDAGWERPLLLLRLSLEEISLKKKKGLKISEKSETTSKQVESTPTDLAYQLP